MKTLFRIWLMLLFLKSTALQKPKSLQLPKAFVLLSWKKLRQIFRETLRMGVRNVKKMTIQSTGKWWVNVEGFIFLVLRLNPQYSSGVSSPGRHVRTRLYFTSESHIHSLVTVLTHGGLVNVWSLCFTYYRDNANRLRVMMNSGKEQWSMSP